MECRGFFFEASEVVTELLDAASFLGVFKEVVGGEVGFLDGVLVSFFKGCTGFELLAGAFAFPIFQDKLPTFVSVFPGALELAGVSLGRGFQFSLQLGFGLVEFLFMGGEGVFGDLLGFLDLGIIASNPLLIFSGLILSFDQLNTGHFLSCLQFFDVLL